ncbi:hypothetical protein [Pseudomonas moorei]|uniref:hypothetical protein n=1 Tax=Pseudomonas moorei TaxID=395599 RepID=UPI001FF0EFEE|nr:hypothetical protein [Pseudomonas moorei]
MIGTSPINDRSSQTSCLDLSLTPITAIFLRTKRDVVISDRQRFLFSVSDGQKFHFGTALVPGKMGVRQGEVVVLRIKVHQVYLVKNAPSKQEISALGEHYKNILGVYG